MKMGILIFLIILFLALKFWKDILWVMSFIGLLFVVLMVGGVINVWGGVSIDSIMPIMMKIIFGFLGLTVLFSILFDGARNFVIGIISNIFK